MTKTILKERILSFQERFQLDFQLMTYARTLEDLSKVPIDARVLLDDFAPVEDLRSRKAYPK